MWSPRNYGRTMSEKTTRSRWKVPHPTRFILLRPSSSFFSFDWRHFDWPLNHGRIQIGWCDDSKAIFYLLFCSFSNWGTRPIFSPPDETKSPVDKLNRRLRCSILRITRENWRQGGSERVGDIQMTCIGEEGRVGKRRSRQLKQHQQLRDLVVPRTHFEDSGTHPSSSCKVVQQQKMRATVVCLDAFSLKKKSLTIFVRRPFDSSHTPHDGLPSKRDAWTWEVPSLNLTKWRTRIFQTTSCSSCLISVHFFLSLFLHQISCSIPRFWWERWRNATVRAKNWGSRATAMKYDERTKIIKREIKKRSDYCLKEHGSRGGSWLNWGLLLIPPEFFISVTTPVTFHRNRDHRNHHVDGFPSQKKEIQFYSFSFFLQSRRERAGRDTTANNEFMIDILWFARIAKFSRTMGNNFFPCTISQENIWLKKDEKRARPPRYRVTSPSIYALTFSPPNAWQKWFRHSKKKKKEKKVNLFDFMEKWKGK